VEARPTGESGDLLRRDPLPDDRAGRNQRLRNRHPDSGKRRR